MQKILSFNEADYNRHISEANRTAKDIQVFIDSVTAISGIVFTDELLSSILNGGGGAVKEALTEKAKQDFEQAGIRSKNVLEAAIKSDTDEFTRLFHSFQASSYTRQPFYDAFTMRGGKVVLREGYEDEQRLRFSNVIMSTAADEIYTLHVAAFEALNKLWEKLPPHARSINNLLPIHFDKRVPVFPSMNYNNLVSAG